MTENYKKIDSNLSTTIWGWFCFGKSCGWEIF